MKPLRVTRVMKWGTRKLKLLVEEDLIMKPSCLCREWDPGKGEKKGREK